MVQATPIADLRATSKQVAKDAGIGNVKKFFDSQKATLLAVLPQHVSPDRMLKIALGALRTTPKLMNCTVESLFGAIVQCAQLGLEPNTPLGHAYLLPFEKNRDSNQPPKKFEVQIIFGYKGLIDLARRSGQIVSISAHEVCQHDRFEYEYGLEEKLVHCPKLNERGKVIAFYAVAKLVGGGYAFEVMSREQVEEIRDASQSYKYATNKNSSVWGEHFVEMGRKTVLRRLFKYLPVSIELATASTLDAKVDHDSQALDTVLNGDYQVVDDEAPTSSEDEPQTLPNDPSEQLDTLSGEVSQAAQPEPAAPQHKETAAQPSATEELDMG